MHLKPLRETWKRASEPFFWFQRASSAWRSCQHRRDREENVVDAAQPWFTPTCASRQLAEGHWRSLLRSCREVWAWWRRGGDLQHPWWWLLPVAIACSFGSNSRASWRNCICAIEWRGQRSGSGSRVNRCGVTSCTLALGWRPKVWAAVEW